MINADRNRFIKQHVELYGEELFLDSITKKSKKLSLKLSKVDLLKNLSSKVDIDLSFDKKNINSKVVFGSGDPNADLLIVGESPSDYEVEYNKPFLGNSGKLLEKILNAIGYSRSANVYFTYLIKFKIDGFRYPLDSEINKFIPLLKKQIEIIEPKMIVGLGKVVGKSLTNKNLSMDLLRNKVHSFSSCPLKITYSPDTLLQYHSLKKLAWEDFQFIRDFVK
ncbi:uracil-DNA glycosylase [bacterium]|nr:MAG: uracil-DNA glycosylase [bacterium]|tara:strand:- start:5407 stop:6072 length:666 start_codon:yes stop_codon:yes gene_type:complete